jgi:hypothetical protein
MGVTVAFDYQRWIARYPEFCSVNEPTAQAYFDEATLYLRNDGTGPVSTESVQLTLLNMLTAHIAKLNATVGGVAPSGLVGRITDATEGSVSVSVDKMVGDKSAAWYQQTQYGASFWQATRAYRTARYRPSLQPVLPGAPFGGGRGFGY